MKLLTIVAVFFATFLAFVAGRYSVNYATINDENAAELQRLHANVLLAHLRSDTDMLLEGSSDDYVIANRGEISRPTLEERKQQFEQYLGATTFTEYQDVVPPIVGVSDNGNLGWVIAQVEASGTQRVAGEARPIEFTSAWIELYEKRDGTWFQVGNVSNFKP